MNVKKMRKQAEAIDALVEPGYSKIMGLGGAYEAADQFDRAMALWSPPMQSADADMIPEKGVMDTRVRDMLRNDGYVQAGQALHRDNIVGSMFMLNAKPEFKALGLDERWAEEFQQEVEAKFTLAAEGIGCWLDASRTNTLTSLVRLAVGVYAAAGEVLATVEWLRETSRPFKTAIQMIDLDRLSTPPEYIPDGFVRGGVRLNSFGAPLGYYIRKAHPTDHDRALAAYEFKYVPAEKPWGRPQVIHIKEQTRPEQTRGVAEMVAGLKEIRITKKFRDITLQNAVVNAMYAASIESDLPSEAVFSQLGGGSIQEGVAGYAEAFLAAVARYTGNGARNMKIDGVKIPHLFPGTKLQLRPAGAPGGVGQDFEVSLLRYLAAVLGVSYEQLSKDFSKTNYSSARAGMTETWKFMMSRKRIVADRFASTIYRCWLEEQINLGNIETMKGARLPNFYDGLNSEAYCACDWIGAARGQIDELKETQAAVLRLKSCLSTHESELAKLGKDWRAVYSQLAREKAERERLGIEVVEDNGVNAASGSPREAEEE
jgi:lambda family phage portal protein